MEEDFIQIDGMAAWNEFWADNEEGLADIGDEETCLAMALKSNLLVGGGAAPLFRIGFAGEDLS